LKNDIKADTPEIFNAPEYDVFVKEVERFDITSETTLVGHSMGAGFGVRYLSKHSEVVVDKVVLVAPWLNLDHEYDFDFFDFDIDQATTERVNSLALFSSDNDSQGVQDTVAFLQKKLPKSVVKEFHNYGHFT
jgi:predicted alpha/beta hydrolase family esterase